VRRTLAAAVLALAVAGCTSATQSAAPGPASSPAASRPATASAAPSHHRRHHQAPPPAASRDGHLVVIHDPGEVTGTLTGPCHTRDGGRLPDRRCTPGAADPAVTQADIHATICVTGYTATVRPPESQTEAFKFRDAYPAYGIPAGVSGELDHLVPLELGGANDAANLWPEAGAIPNPKDAVENALREAVCAGQVTLARAQRAIARNWETAEARLGLATSAPSQPPAPPPSSAPSAPAGCHPTTPSGNCYEPGEYCPEADAGTTGVAGDGKTIVCRLVSGRYHWED
jgi:hypothetical protein